MPTHHNACGCSSCQRETVTKKEKELNISISENSRREFLKKASGMGLALGVGAGLISPLAASALNNEDAALLSQEMANSQSVKTGKASRLTLLHTADIHSQLLIHDEFFIENGKPVYKKRGGFATLKTMVNELRKENPENTLVIDGGDCFQGGGVAALTEGRAIVPLMNNIGYDLMLPGNWEVVYKKKKMLYDMGHANAAKICANMWHKTNDADNGEFTIRENR